MSQYGSPPDPNRPDPNQPDPNQPGQNQPRPASADPEPYNPYPDNWNTPGGTSGQPSPYGQSDPYATSGQPSPYGQPDPYAAANPYGQPSPYAAAGQPGSPANPYAGAVSTKPTFGFGGYAGWLTRVGATLIDQVLGLVVGAPLWIGYVILLSNTTTTTNPDGTTTTDYSGSATVPIVLIVLGALTSLAFYIWNVCIRQGRTGATVGKSVLAIRLVNSDMQPIGAGWSFLRSILHVVDSICYIGYLWPIWDSRKQTFADKIMNTFVIQATTQEPRPY